MSTKPMVQRIIDLEESYKENLKENKKYFQRLKKRPNKRLDLIVQELHDKEFAKTDCLDCGNCCKTTSPIFTEKDITRISKHLKMKENIFMNDFLDRDDDDYYVLKTAPCFFLDSDNSCSIYDVRPKACKEYPHTNRRKFHQLGELTIANTAICPATHNILENLKKINPLS